MNTEKLREGLEAAGADGSGKESTPKQEKNDEGSGGGTPKPKSGTTANGVPRNPRTDD